MAKVCPECGREYENRSIICRICGLELEEVPTRNQAKGTATNQMRPQTAQQKPVVVNIQEDEEETYLVAEPQAGPSGLSITALVFSLLGCLSVVGFVLGIIDLCINKYRKKVCSVLAIVFCGLWTIGMLAWAVASNETKSPALASTGDSGQTGGTSNNQGSNQGNNESLESASRSTDTSASPQNSDLRVDIVGEYTLPDGIGWYTRRFIIIRNNSSETVDVSTSSLAYASDGTMLSAANCSFEALGTGCTSVLYESFETDATISYYDTDLECESSRYYESVIQDLSYVQNNVDGGAVFQVTNNGRDAADFVEGYALFFKNGVLVSYERAYFTDDDSELKPGVTISKQLTSYEDFDTIQFYLTGRK